MPEMHGAGRVNMSVGSACASVHQYIDVSLLSHNNDLCKIKINERLTKLGVTFEDRAIVFVASLGSYLYQTLVKFFDRKK